MKKFTTILEAAGIKENDKDSIVSSVGQRRINLNQIAGPYINWHKNPSLSLNPNLASKKDLIKILGISSRVADLLINLRKIRKIYNSTELLNVKGIGKKTIQKNRFNLIFDENSHPHIINLELIGEGNSKIIKSNSRYGLKIKFINASKAAVGLVKITIYWDGMPYTIEKIISKREAANGEKTIKFGKEDFLSVGPVRFQVKLYDAQGGITESGIGTYVLPNNPLQVRLTPGRAHFSSWIVRAELNNDDRSFKTFIDWTVSNTTGRTRRFSVVEWIATDGGGHVETINANFSFSVGNNRTSSFRTTLSSSSNSPIGQILNKSGDITIKIRLIDDRGEAIEDTIVVQPWLGYNLNIIRVGNLQSGDRTGLRRMANHASSLFQQINLSMNRLENNWSVIGEVSEWDSIDLDEVRDLFDYASVSNDGLDLFIVRDFTGGTGASFEPGECQKGGDEDGIIMDRRYDGSGNLYWRGMGITLAHEAGHYFGLSHTPNDSDFNHRIMFPSFLESKSVFTWEEYYEAYKHCFIYLIYNNQIV